MDCSHKHCFAVFNSLFTHYRLGILPRALSHKVFGYMGYLWDNRDDFDPYLGVGLSGEFANTNPCNNATCSQWAIWVKGGIAY
jgi:hypothetical protein